MNDSINTEEMSDAEKTRIAILDALGLSLATKRREAIAARSASGIEKIWEEDEAFYQGYDDANRHEFTTAPRSKNSLGSDDQTPRTKGSTVFPNITQPYVDAAAARIGDTLIPSDDRNFVIEPSPIPTLLPEDVPAPPQQAMAQVMPPMPEGAPPGVAGMPMPPPQAPVDEDEQHDEAVDTEAKKRAGKAQKRIDDWLKESAFHDEVRNVLDDCARLGSGVIKGPVPVVRSRRQIRQTDAGTEIVIIDEIKPGSMQISPWNLFPHGACGDSIHNGEHLFERDFLSGKQIRALKKAPGYLAGQIDLCLEEGPKGAEDVGGMQSDVAMTTKDLFAVWYFYGDIEAEELEAAGVELPESMNREAFPALLTMVNDRVIHAALNPLDTGKFPYDVIPWKRRPGMPWGTGVARMLRTPQRIVTAATRNLMDNAGRAGGPQFVLRRGVKPQNGTYEIVPDKIWEEGDDADGQSGAPFLSVVIPMLQNELQAIIQMGLKMAEDVTGMPQLMQGSQGAAPDTVGGMQILNNNANAVLRRIARLFDARLTVPHIQRYIDWLNDHGEDDEKGDFDCIARGSTALVERDIQTQEMTNIVGMTLNPAFGKNPEKAMDEFLRSRRFDPKAFDFSPEEKAKRASQPPPVAPQVQVAQIRAQSEAQKIQFLAQEDQQKTQAQLAAERDLAQLADQTERLRIQRDTDRDTVYANAEAQRTQTNAAEQQRELEAKLQLAQLDYASKHSITIEQLKAKLAETTMKLNTTRELAAASGALDLHKHHTPSPVMAPPIEPPGQAQPGQSYAQ